MSSGLDLWRAEVIAIAVCLAAAAAPAVAADDGGFVLRPDAVVKFDPSTVTLPPDESLLRSGDSRDEITPGADAVTPAGQFFESFGIGEVGADLLEGSSGSSRGSLADSAFFRLGDVFALDDSGPFEHAEYPLRRITDATKYPFRAAGQVDSGCSGSMVGPKYVLTAGHCVYDIKTNEWKKNLNFTPGRNGAGDAPYGTIAWARVVAPKGWTRDHRMDHDYALIILNDKVGDKVGWMSFGYNNGLGAGENIVINQYPGNRPAGTMWQSNCPIREAGGES